MMGHDEDELEQQYAGIIRMSLKVERGHEAV